jgi:hypothetical protein
MGTGTIGRPREALSHPICNPLRSLPFAADKNSSERGDHSAPTGQQELRLFISTNFPNLSSAGLWDCPDGKTLTAITPIETGIFVLDFNQHGVYASHCLSD